MGNTHLEKIIRLGSHCFRVALLLGTMASFCFILILLKKPKLINKVNEKLRADNNAYYQNL